MDAGEGLDEEIADAIEGAAKEIGDSERADFDRVLCLLVRAFREGRWGTFLAGFEEPLMAVRWLASHASSVTPHVAKGGPRLLGRLVQRLSAFSLVVAQGEVTALERQVAELSAQVASQGELLELKDSLLHLVLHEVRRPITLVRGHASMLQGGDYGEVPEPMREPIRHVADAVSAMEHLVGELALAERLETGAELLRKEPSLLEPVIEEAVLSVAYDAERRDVQVVKRVTNPDLQATVDRARVTLAVANLLDNAVKYSPPGSHVEVRLEARLEEIAISVSDEGPGVPAGDESKVFEKHFRSRRQAQDSADGLGLGLYLVRQLVSLHGGRVTLDTTTGRGTTFTILLPMGLSGSSRAEGGRS